MYGISKDSLNSHERFANKYGLKMPLLADIDGVVCRNYGVWQEKTLFGKLGFGIQRTTYVIDAGGRIASVFPKVKVDGHAEAVLKVVQQL